ncbi:MAG: hypothetical protein JNJ89_15065 [Rubrivivax sp.]|nr:hypothetical protein [Rubrivivax sp.]
MPPRTRRGAPRPTSPAPPAARPPAGPRRRAFTQAALAAPWVLLGPLGLGACGGSSGGSDPPPRPTFPPAPPPLPAGPPVFGPAWAGFAGGPQHQAQAALAPQPLAQVRWRTPVDLAPPYSTTGSLRAHYGSPVISARNTVVLALKQRADGGFRFEGRRGSNGELLWNLDSDLVLPPHDWVPVVNPVITPGNQLIAPRAGGRLIVRADVDATAATAGSRAFYGDNVYAAAPAAYDATVRIHTPLTADAAGNVFFGFVVTGANPAGLVSGIARIGADGSGNWVAAATAAGDAGISQVAMNCAPALSADGATLYVAVNSPPGSRQRGRLLALDSTTLATRASVPLLDPASGAAAWVSDNATSSPTVGPDGDVFFGVLEAGAPAHHFRGWLLHFDAALGAARTPGSFGWDTTAAVVPAGTVPAYRGSSTYLLATKYNDYYGAGGTGQHRIALLDPHAAEPDRITPGVAVMREVISQLGPTPDPQVPEIYGGVKEWCINTMAVDVATQSILVNNEDGLLYRWDLVANRLVEPVVLTSGLGAAYTPTAIGPDGAVYAINNATLFSVGR